MNLDFITRCPICPNTNRCVRGDGPSNATVMCVGEEPGREEDAGGRPFIGQAGKEFNNNYLPLAGLARDDVYVTNARKCRQNQNKTPTYNEMIGCANHFMPHELSEVNPTVVILMGSTACKLLGERGVDLESEHGIPRWGSLYGWEGWIVPINHPAAGLHDGNMMQPMLEDWARLEPWLRNGTWSWAEDKVGERDYRLCRTGNQIIDYFQQYKGLNLRHSIKLDPLAGVDSETHDGQRWSFQASIKPGTGIMVQTDTGEFDPELLPELRYYLEAYEWALHYAEADLWVMDLLGMTGHPYRDTIQEAYQFQNLPQKLKAISRRVLGRTRVSWDELVTPYSKARLHEWMRDGILYAEDNWRTVTARVHKKTGKALKPDVKRSEVETLLFEIDGYMLNNPDYQVWGKLIERVPEEWLRRCVDVVGPIPQKGIAHVPLELAVHYGCSDADDTLAAALAFDGMRKQFKAELDVQPEDRDNVVSPTVSPFPMERIVFQQAWGY